MDYKRFPSAVLAAAERIRPYVRRTPVDEAEFLNKKAGPGTHVYIKLESEQVTGSFKTRGACNKILKAGDSLKERRITFASTGNHALACLYVMRQTGVSGSVFVPSTISPVKEALLLEKGAQLIKCGPDCLDGELRARAAAEADGSLLIPPYNDEDVIAGQGTVGLELLEQLPDLDAVFVSVGGGGLIGGIAAYIKQRKPNIQVVGCQPAASAVLSASVRAGRVLDMDSQPTLSDGTAGGVEQGTITLDVCMKYVDRWLEAGEEEIGRALYETLSQQHKLVEGAAALAVACFSQVAQEYDGKTVAIIACGANVSMDTVKLVLEKYH